MALSLKRQKFVDECLATPNDIQGAYVRAGYSDDKATLETNPYRLLAEPEIQQALAEARTKLGKKLSITAEKVIYDLEVLKVKAAAAGQFHAAIRAVQLQAEYCNVFPDSDGLGSLPEAPVGDDLSAVPTRELARKVLFSLMLGMRRGDAASGVPAAPTVMQ